jgi:hypothetical protein
MRHGTHSAMTYINVVAIKQSHADVGSWRVDFPQWKMELPNHTLSDVFSILQGLKTRWHRDCKQSYCCAEN